MSNNSYKVCKEKSLSSSDLKVKTDYHYICIRNVKHLM